MFLLYCIFFFFFKQKTAYEMRISDWSSDVCSSDLLRHQHRGGGAEAVQYLAELHGDIGAAGRGDIGCDMAAPAGQKRQVDAADRFEQQGIGQDREMAVVISEERRVGKACVSTCRYRWSP